MNLFKNNTLPFLSRCSRVGFSVFAAALFTGVASADDGRPEQPNILLMLADDLGWQDVKCYDIDEPSPYETPNIDGLAKDGVMFWQGYSAAPVCAPSRCAMLSGIHPARANKTSVRGGTPPSAYNLNGMRVMEPWQSARLVTNQATLAELLRANGYATGHSGKWHINIKPSAEPLPKDVGFDWSEESMGVARDMVPNRVKGFSTHAPDDPWQLDAQNYPKNGIFDDAVTFMEAEKDQPFFLFCAARLVHSPIQTRSKVLLEKYCKKLGIPFPKDASPMTRPGQQNPYYCAMIEEFDYYVGNLLTYLETTEDPRWPGHMLRENTYIIFTSDNGGMEKLKGDIITDNYPLDGGKIRLEEGGTRVPLIIVGPNIPADVQTEVMANGLDFYPTILTMTGIEAPEGLALDGSDLYPLLTQAPQDPTLVKEPDGGVRDTMMWHFPNSVAQYSTIRVGDYKLVRNYDFINNRSVDSELELYQLYDTRDGEASRVDIEESKNLVASMPEKAEELNAKLTELLTSMNASHPYYNPLYQGELPHKETVPAITSAERNGDIVRATFKENGAKVVRAQLLYTTLGGDANEEWFVAPATIEDGSVVATLPEGTTHYLFNIIDENNYLVSYPAVKSQAAYKGRLKYSQDALSAAR
ncbi:MULTISPECIES: sulfatase [unclassified Lentimonas]|uniref:sulfatase n=1 Tax=unclassified Lentimonas TaxID=2630993 RepID=UPI00132A3A1D|nr:MULTISPECIES: sulfatase [unclassified Lentimonas]CAA6689525.1 Choline-sulfatase (EC [Lentimonas sp. CC19]CAA6692528.1 Choline-sulfatase (EC [Lentimonas sp. CC10]CAA7069167.1 Choline-sulfatase (EC [Lentimonas sp. CC11]